MAKSKGNELIDQLLIKAQGTEQTFANVAEADQNLRDYMNELEAKVATAEFASEATHEDS